MLARDLVNEPANILGPVEFAAKAKELEKLGVEVEVLEPARLRELGMGALLAVAQGSTKEPRVAIMRWNGGPAGEAPVALIGKGVIFDSGGISIKPGGGMEDMKGDMGGAAAVVGALRALAARKARCNVVGAIGIVENMPDGGSYRPSDIVTSMSGQTIEVINTDAQVYGGDGAGNFGSVFAASVPQHGRPASAEVTLPASGMLWLVHEGS